MSKSKKNNNLEISWLGMDGLLLALFFVVAGTIFWGILNKNDLLMGTIIPYGLMIGVTFIFLNYLSHVFNFSKPQNKEQIVETKKAKR
jgi:inner membrane protein involved in colicin E2 resistance